MRTKPRPEEVGAAIPSAEIERLLADRGPQFPVTRACRYLDHAAFGPLPRRATSAALEALTALPSDERWRASRLTERARAAAADLLHAPAESVCLLKNTIEGISLVAKGLTWRPGDEVLVHEREFAGAVYPWLDLRREGVVVKTVRDDGSGRFSATDFERELTPRTRAVCVSLVNATTGYRAPVSEIAQVCERSGAWLVVDAVQALGAIDVDVASLGADVIAAHSYKFLLAGFGVAAVHCSPRAIAELYPPQVGWRNGHAAVGERWGEEDEGPAPSDGTSARRFETSLLSAATLAAFEANVGMLLTLGPEPAARIQTLGAQIEAGLRTLGYAVITPPERGAIIATRHPWIDSEEIRALLAAREIVVSVRGGLLRFSPHFYNTAQDIEDALRWLPK